MVLFLISVVTLKVMALLLVLTSGLLVLECGDITCISKKKLCLNFVFECRLSILRLWKGNLILQVLSKSSGSTPLMNLKLSAFCEPLLQGHCNSVHQCPMADWEISERYHPFTWQLLSSIIFFSF